MLLNIAILEDDPKQSKELYKLLTTWAACHGHVFHIYQYTNGPSLLQAITQKIKMLKQVWRLLSDSEKKTTPVILSF